MTAVSADPLTIDHLDFRPLCEIPNCPADNPEATHGFLLVCGDVELVCTTCAELFADRMDWTVGWAQCNVCKIRWGPGRIRDYIKKIFPLGS